MTVESIGAIVAAVLPAVAQVVKVMFGMDEPEKHKVIKHESSVPVGTDDELLADFGLRSVRRPADRD